MDKAMTRGNQENVTFRLYARRCLAARFAHGDDGSGWAMSPFFHIAGLFRSRLASVPLRS